MGMASDKFVRHRSERIGNGKRASFSGDLREEYSLEDVIAKLFAERHHVVALNGVDHFVRLFEHELRERPRRLLAIPGASLRRAKGSHEVDETDELFGGFL